MNRRFLSLSLVVALVLGASSCGKKSSNEPIKPNPTTPAPSNNGGSTAGGSTAGGSSNGGNGNTTTGENNSGNNNSNGGSTNAGNTNSGNAQESNASVTLTVPAGKSVTINGTTYTGNSQNKIFLNDSSLEISGDDLSSLGISGDNLTEVKIKKEMAKLKALKIVSKVRNANKTLALDLSGLTNVTSLTLAGYKFTTVDLSKMAQLRFLHLGLAGNTENEKDTSFEKVIWPKVNNIQHLHSRSPLTEQIVDLNNLPNLLEARLISPYFGKVSFDKSTKLQLVLVSNPHGSKNFDLELKNHPDLQDVSLNGVTVKKFVITNAPNLSSQKSSLRDVKVGELELTGVSKEGVVKILQSIDKNSLKKAVLPGYDFTLGTAPLDGFSNLNTANVTLK